MALLAVLAPAAARADTGFVHRVDTQIVDGSGAPLALRGVDVGNWLIWENWDMGSAQRTAVAQNTMVPRLASLVGQARADRFRTDVYNNYITLADFQEIRDLGFNVVRVPINHDILEDDAAPGVYKDSGWRLLDNVMAWARQTGLYVVLDMHAAPGGQNPWFHADPDRALKMWAPVNRARTIALWQAIAARYRDEPAIAAYDLLNEPFPSSDDELLSVYADLTAAVRAADPNHMLIYEGRWAASDSSMFAARFDDNMAISFHQYMWPKVVGHAESDLQRDLVDAQRLDVPLWAGEFGQDSPRLYADRVRRYDQEPLINGWAAWTWKGALLPDGRLFVTTFTPTAAWQKLINYLAIPFSPKPTPAEAEQGMQDYIALISAATPQHEVIRALQTPRPGTGTGLTGTYYADASFTTPKLTRTDPTVNFNWGWGAPASGLPADNFTARWTGSIEPRYSDPYTFTTTVDDAVRVWIDGQLVIDDWSTGRHSKSGTINLVAGQRYSIRVDYLERNMGAAVKLEWESPLTARETVPTSQLYPG